MILQNRNRRKNYRRPLQKYTLHNPTPPKKLPYTRLKLSPDEIAKVQ